MATLRGLSFGSLTGCREMIALSRGSIKTSLFPDKHFSTASTKVDEDQDLLQARPYSEVPKPKHFLNMNWDLIKNPLMVSDYVEEQVKSVGKIFKEKAFPGLPELVFVVDPTDIEKVYRAGDKEYPKRLQLEDWIKARQDLNLPLGMFLDNDEEWLEQRIPVSKYIMMPRKMADYSGPFNDVALDLVQYIRNHRDGGHTLSDLVTAMNKWSLESISLFVLGKRLGSFEDPLPPDCKEFIDSVHGFITTTNSLLTSIPFHKVISTKTWKDLLRHLDMLYSYASGLILSKIEEIERDATKELDEEDVSKDFLTYMVYSGKMDVKQLAVNAVDLLGAGVDTTSVTTASCLYSLATNPDVQEKLRSEIWEVVGDELRVTSAHVQKMQYLRDCIKETQRLYPIAPSNARILKEDIVLSGYRIPAGVPIAMSTVVSGRLSDNFAEPEKFKPERWDRDSEDHPHPFASLPFGFGRRMCVGRRVAELEMYIGVSQLIRNFRISFAEDTPIHYVTNLFYYPSRQMNLTFSDL